MITSKGIHIALPVQDVTKTAEFYSALVGMELLYETHYYDRRFVMMKLGEHRYSFFERPENIPLASWLSKSGENPFHIGFIVDNSAAVDHAVIECRERGIEVVIGPRDRDDVTERAMYCLDPSGYQVEIYCENAHT